MVFDIKEFAIHDGPGLRTTVFLKGCPLNCTWCHNPEGRSRYPQTMQTAHSQRTVGKVYTAAALAERLNRQAEILHLNGGGVTFSGGEPLAQAGFLRAALERCRERGLHTALDTCGQAPREQAEDFARRADLFLYDLKCMDPRRHRAATGAPNDLILENLRAICALGAAVWVRLPLIPGFNDDEENLRATAEFVRALPGRPPLSLLPYHPTAAAKYRRLGRPFPAEGLAAPAPDFLQRISTLLKSLGLDVALEG